MMSVITDLMSSVSTVPSLDEEVRAWLDHDPGIQARPFDLYRRLQSEAPVYRAEDRILVTGYPEARSILTAPGTLQGISAKGSRYRTASERLDAERRLELAQTFGFFEKRLGGSNGEHHTRLRKLAQRAFTPRMVALMEQRIEGIATDMLDPLVGRDEIELIGDFAYHLPLIVISEMLDIPTDDRDDLRHWANDIGHFVGADWSSPEMVSETHRSMFALRTYLHDLFAVRRAGGDTTDLLGNLLSASEDGDEFTEDELVAMVVQFVFAGHETSTNFIGNFTVLLRGARQDLWNDLLSEPELVPSAVEELLRVESPTQYVDKLATEDGELAGCEIHAWDTISVVVAAANYDPRVFAEPDTIDFRRQPNPHLTFGFGAHHCLGAALARMEAQVVLRTFLRRFPDMRLSPGPVEWRRNHMLRGPERLPVSLGPDHG